MQRPDPYGLYVCMYVCMCVCVCVYVCVCVCVCVRVCVKETTGPELDTVPTFHRPPLPLLSTVCKSERARENTDTHTENTDTRTENTDTRTENEKATDTERIFKLAIATKCHGH